MSSKNILYGIQGEGRGHASRSLHIIEQLKQRGYDVCIFTGGDALSIIKEQNIPYRNVPVFRFSHDRDGAVSLFRTSLSNFSQFLGILLQSGKRYKSILSEVKKFDPDFIISDFEPYLSRIANRLGIPSMVINHQNYLIESQLPPFHSFRKNIKLRLLQTFIRLFSCKPDRVIVSAFHHFPVHHKSKAVFVGPYIPQNIRHKKTSHGTHFTVYLKEPHYIEFILPVIRKFKHISFEIFSNWNQLNRPLPEYRHIFYHSIQRKKFLNSLASSGALLTTAGNQVIGEAICFRKPILAFPKLRDLEQELNGKALAASGCGNYCHFNEFSEQTIQNFISKIRIFQQTLFLKKADKVAYDGTARTIELIDRFAAEIELEKKEIITLQLGKIKMKFNPYRLRLGIYNVQ